MSEVSEAGRREARGGHLRSENEERLSPLLGGERGSSRKEPRKEPLKEPLKEPREERGCDGWLSPEQELLAEKFWWSACRYEEVSEAENFRWSACRYEEVSEASAALLCPS